MGRGKKKSKLEKGMGKVGKVGKMAFAEGTEQVIIAVHCLTHCLSFRTSCNDGNVFHHQCLI